LMSCHSSWVLATRAEAIDSLFGFLSCCSTLVIAQKENQKPTTEKLENHFGISIARERE